MGLGSKLIGKAEKLLGQDLDGDGTVGGAEGDTRELVRKAFSEALGEGITTAVQTASRSGGFSDNPRVRIPFPEEVDARAVDLIKQFLPDQYESFVAKMNEAAERAAGVVRDVLIGVLHDMDLSKALGLILSERPDACTEHFRETSEDKMYEGMKGIVDSCLKECFVFEIWGRVTTMYNEKVPSVAKMAAGVQPEINTDIGDYSTRKAIKGLLVYISDKERAIRDNPVISSSIAVQKVFDHDYIAELRAKYGN